MTSVRHHGGYLRNIALRGAAAILIATLAVPALAAQSTGEATVATPSYRIYSEHVGWRNDCVPAASPAAGPAYDIYDSHVSWRDDEVPVAGAPEGPDWQLYPSHVVRTDACSQHPSVASKPVPDISWSQVEHFLAG